MQKNNKDLFLILGNKKIEPNEKDTTQEMTEKINGFCQKLFIASDKFDKNAAFDDLVRYIDKYGRILYAPISGFIYACYNEHEVEDAEKLIGNMNTNMEAIVSYVYSEEYEEKLKLSSKKKVFTDTKKVIIKIWDHINLAQYQYSALKQTDDEYKRKFNDSIEPIKDNISKELNAQLLTMVSIFTALAFLIFGGISSLDNIFMNQELPLLKLMIVGSVWGLCILNLIFVFLFCITKMTNLNFKSTQNESANIFQKYPVVWWSNFILCSIMVICTWMYYVTTRKIHKWFELLCTNHPMLISILGTTIIVIIVLKIGKKLISEIRNKNE